MVNLFDVVNSYQRINTDLDAIDLAIDALLSRFQGFDFLNKHHGFHEIFVFGDSLSDSGNCFKETKKATGEGLPPTPPYSRGRFSNGPVWVEYLTRLLQLSSRQVTNFATGGANTGNTNTFIPNNPLGLPGLQQEIDRFITPFKTTGRSVNPHALCIVWAGANDYLSGSTADPAVPIANLVKAVNTLTSVGAKHILIGNLPDLGELPATRNNPEQSAGLKALTQAHNAGLAAAILSSQQSLGTSVSIQLFDVNSLFKQVFTQPTQQGFTNVTDAELEQLARLGGYAEKFFFWDVIHPTTAAHLALAKAAVALLTPQVAKVS